MVKLVGVFGMDRSACPAYKATQTDNDTLRAKIAGECAELFKQEFKPEDVHWDDCTVGGRHLGFCGMCELRRCGAQHQSTTCADCPDYLCAELQERFELVPLRAKENLRRIRAERR